VRVLILSHPVDTPSVKYRILQFLPLFKKDGIHVERVDIPKGLLGRWSLLRSLGDYDVVVHQKRLLPPWQFRALRKRAKKLVYDFDDPMVYSREGNDVRLSDTRVARFRSIVEAADAVVVNHVGTEAMAREHGGKNVHVIPTSVDLSRWRMRDSWASDRFTLGWVGTPANLPNLKDIAPALQGHRLSLVTDEPLALPGVDVEFVKWDFATEPENVRRFDAALAPLPDDLWSRAKMPFKILYYFAAGVPVVASRLGAVETVIRDGENGLLAGDWREKIEALRDAGLREKLGRAGRRTVEAEFTVEAAYAKWKALLATLA
jgi:glycosyltransferase involved in cell wall biosynthesis